MTGQVARSSQTARIQLLGLVNGETHEFSGLYVVSYDAEYHLPDGQYDGGDLVCTPDRDKAGKFDFATLLAIYKSGPTCKCHGIRADGHPNRPLTMFNVAIDYVMEAVAKEA